jgi:hypothetical protein
MAATVEYMHVCDYAFPAQNGKPGIIGIFSWIAGPAFPLVHPFMSIAVQLRSNAHELIPFVISLERQNGEVVQRFEGNAPAGEDGGAFICANLVNVVFPTDGRHTVKVSSAGQTLVLQSLELKKIQGGPAQPSGPTH